MGKAIPLARTVVIAIAALLFTTLVQQPARAQDLPDPRLEGQWMQTAEITDGHLMGMTIEGNQISVHVYRPRATTTDLYVFEIEQCDPAADPMRINLRIASVPEYISQEIVDQVALAIYQVDGDQLTILLGEPGDNIRPRMMSGGWFSKQFIGRWYSPQGRDAPTEHALNDDGVDQALIGQWATSHDTLRTVFHADRVTVARVDDLDTPLAAWDITHWDPAADPKQLDMKPTVHPNPNLAEQPLHQVYKFEGDTLVIATTHPFTSETPDQRPTSFDPGPGVIVTMQERD